MRLLATRSKRRWRASSMPSARPACTAGRRARAGVLAGIASLLRHGRRRRAGRVPRMQALPSGRRRRGRSVDREDPPRLRVPVERRRSPVAGDARGASRRQPVSPSSAISSASSASRRANTPTRAGCEGKAQSAPRRRRHRRDVRRRLRIEQPVLRARGAETRDGAVHLSARRRRHGDRLHDRRFAEPSLGRLLVAATTRGVCAVAMGSTRTPS